MQFSKIPFRKRSGTTLAGICGAAVVSVLLLCGAGNTPTGNIQTSDLNANGHAITNAATVSATNISARCISTTSTHPLLFGLGTEGLNVNGQAGFVEGLSADMGQNYTGTRHCYVPVPGGATVRDMAAITNLDGTIYKNSAGQRFYACTTGQYGQCGYIAIISTPDFVNWNFVADIPITGSSVQVKSLAITASSGSTTITLPSTSISGLTNGNVYGISGLAGLPPEAAFKYNSASTTQTLGYQADSTDLVSGQTMTTTAAVSGTGAINAVVHAWMGSAFVDTDGTMGLGVSLGGLGMGYITCSNPGTFTNWSSWTPWTLNVGSTGINPTTLYSAGVFYNAANATYYLGAGANYYATSSTARGTFTVQPELNIASGLSYDNTTIPVNYGDQNTWYLWCFSVNPGGNDAPGFSKSTTGVTGTFSAPIQSNMLAGSVGVAGIQVAPLRSTDDINAAEAAMLSPYAHTAFWSNSYNIGGGNAAYLGTDLNYLILGVTGTLTGTGQSIPTDLEISSTSVTVPTLLSVAQGIQDTYSGHTNTLAAYDNTGILQPVNIGTNLSYNTSTKTLSASSGGISSIVVSNGLTGSPTGTITSTGTISLNTASTNTWTAPQTITSTTGTTTPQLTIAYDGTHTATFRVDNSGNLNIGGTTTSVQFSQQMTVPTGNINNLNAYTITFPYYNMYMDWGINFTGVNINQTAGGYWFYSSNHLAPSLGISSVDANTIGVGNGTVGDISKSISVGGLIVGGGTKVTEIRMGTGTLASGAATISDAAIATTSAIEVTHLGSSVSNAGSLVAYPTGTGAAAVKSANASDNDTFTYIVVNH